MRRQLIRVVQTARILSLTLLATQVHAQARELEKHFRDEYRDKTLVLRGFYSGDRLRYGSSRAPSAGASSGDWTSAGFVQVKDIHFSRHRLRIEANRLLVIQFDGKQFQFLQESKPERHELKIEADLDPGDVSPEQADAVMSRIFLTSHDDLAALVSNSWKPCVRAAAIGKDTTFSFSPEFLSIPGVVASEAGMAAPTGTSENQWVDCSTRKPNRRGIYPTDIYQPPPEYSDRARRAKFQGQVILMLVVNEKGLPENIRITKPLGFGLDEKALSCVEKWRFKPAEKDGQPLATEIALEVDFRLY